MTIPAPTITRPNPAFERAVDLRTVALCRAHSDDGSFNTHCPDQTAHWQEARRQLLMEFQSQEYGG